MIQVFPTNYGLVVYPSECRTVTLEQEPAPDSGKKHSDVISVHVDNIDSLIRALRSAKKEAEGKR